MNNFTDSGYVKEPNILRSKVNAAGSKRLTQDKDTGRYLIPIESNKAPGKYI